MKKISNEDVKFAIEMAIKQAEKTGSIKDTFNDKLDLVLRLSDASTPDEKQSVLEAYGIEVSIGETIRDICKRADEMEKEFPGATPIEAKTYIDMLVGMVVKGTN